MRNPQCRERVEQQEGGREEREGGERESSGVVNPANGIWCGGDAGAVKGKTLP